MKKWTEKELKFLINHYVNISNLNLTKSLDRTIFSINNKAKELNLRKSKEYISNSKRKLKINISKVLLIRMYTKEKKSFRTIAKELNVGKTTIEYYLKKYEIKRRGNLEIQKKKWI